VEKINSLTGMMDLIANKSNKEELPNKIFHTEKVLESIFKNFSISQIRTPSLEYTHLFERSVGETSDIVNKELYTFLDKNEKSITLRPEGTASVLRSLIEKKLDGDSHKLWYLGPMWRYERPQKGRYRQFNQAGVEILGYEEGMAEFEMISIISSINKRLKIEKPIIKINHLGNHETKKNFCDALVEYLKPLQSKLEEKDLTRLNSNPLRILDSKSSETQEILTNGPRISEYLPKKSLEMMDMIVSTFSQECEIQIDQNLVRGLDYYTGFVFEAISSNLGAQDAYLGGGRYDNLCKHLGGKDLPAIGMAIGIERLSLLSNVLEGDKTSISIIIISNNTEPKAYKIAHDLRSLNNNINFDIQLSDGSLKSKLRRANKDNADYAIIIGEEELKSNTVIVKPLSDNDSEQTTMDLNDLDNFIKNVE
jgi:histidyl-tRNA synthetase